MRAQIGAPASTAAVLVAESGDQAAVDAIVSRTQVVLSTAGPFALYGSPVVDACVRFKTHIPRLIHRVRFTLAVRTDSG